MSAVSLRHSAALGCPVLPGCRVSRTVRQALIIAPTFEVIDVVVVEYALVRTDSGGGRPPSPSTGRTARGRLRGRALPVELPVLRCDRRGGVRPARHRRDLRCVRGAGSRRWR